MSAILNIENPCKQTQTTFLLNFLYVLGGSFFLALMAQFSIPLWFTPVPITLQTFGVLLIGAFLGSKKGALTILTYLAEGCLGFPVFAGGSAGFAMLAGPRGGYLLGFILCAFWIGLLIERRWCKNFVLTLMASFSASLLILGFGVWWLSSFIGFTSALSLGFYPFLLGEVFKMAAASTVIRLRSRSIHLSFF